HTQQAEVIGMIRAKAFIPFTVVNRSSRMWVHLHWPWPLAAFIHLLRYQPVTVCVTKIAFITFEWHHTLITGSPENMLVNRIRESPCLCPLIKSLWRRASGKGNGCIALCCICQRFNRIQRATEDLVAFQHAHVSVRCL